MRNSLVMLSTKIGGFSRKRQMRECLTSAAFQCFVIFPLVVLVVEHSYISTNMKSDDSSLLNPVASHQHVAKISTLSDLTSSFHANECPNKRHVKVDNIEANAERTQPLPTRKIPRIIHQTGKSRCVTERVAWTIRKWLGYQSFRYYYHDDEAVLRLLQQEFPEFPHLGQLSSRCLVHGTVRSDVWRYVVLWVYGGIYADMDAVPAKFHPETSIDSDTDGLFVVEQYHLLSQWFMAVSPRHPLMYYAIHHSLANLLRVADIGAIAAPIVTGPHALHAAYRDFRRDAGVAVDPIAPGNFPVRAGVFTGTHNRTVHVLGVAAQQNEYVNRDALGAVKWREYKKMGMRHFQEDKKHPTGISCLQALLDGFDQQ